MKWIFLVAAVLFETIATLSLKYSDGFTKIIPSIIVVIGYGCSFYFLSAALKFIPLSVAYAIWSGLGIFTISLISVFIFKQKIDFAGIAGLSLIAAGVIIINAFSKMVAH